MNKASRAMLNKQQDRITALKDLIEKTISAFADEVSSIRDEIEAVKDEEEEALSNLSYNLQGSERGQAMEQAVMDMDTAYSALDELVGALDADEIESILTSAFDALEEAKGMA